MSRVLLMLLLMHLLLLLLMHLLLLLMHLLLLLMHLLLLVVLCRGARGSLSHRVTDNVLCAGARKARVDVP